ncbi:MAG TPA: glycosyltransferase family 2 protein [Candidatus Acidoferrum sp.]|nr:glycosyltransferase family 2 protein [Candidatus Acidoferrum sp.]
MDTLSVGIVMRTKNRAVLLRRAMESVLNQRYQNWQLVIVNDGGLPEEVEFLVQHFAESLKGRVRVIHNPQSLGMEAAGNLALKDLNSDLAVVHDDDDTWSPEFLARMITVYAMEKRRFPKVGGIVCHANKVVERVEGNLITIEQLEHYNQWIQPGVISLERMCECNMFPPISFLFELAVCKQIGQYNELLTPQADWDFNVRFMLERDIWLLSESLAFYHHRQNASGDLSNTVVAGVEQHYLLRKMMDNEWLRNDIKAGRFGLGAFVALRSYLGTISHKLDK